MSNAWDEHTSNDGARAETDQLRAIADDLTGALHEARARILDATQAFEVRLQQGEAEILAQSIGRALCTHSKAADALADAVTEHAASAMRAVQATMTKTLNRYALAPLSSLVFAFVVGVLMTSVGMWAIYHGGYSLGVDQGYQFGYTQGRAHGGHRP